MHTEESISVCGAEVQKGNAPTERKLQRMFRRPEVSRIIKKCNDFGAGGVSVAIGELAAGLVIDLDKVPKKYAAWTARRSPSPSPRSAWPWWWTRRTWISSWPTRRRRTWRRVKVAEVTREPRLVMTWRGTTIVDISRAFLDTNGAHQEADVTLTVPGREGTLLSAGRWRMCAAPWMKMLASLNVCSQKGLVEMFDGSIGAGSVYMPYGGKYQLTETQSMVAKLPLFEGPYGHRDHDELRL